MLVFRINVNIDFIIFAMSSMPICSPKMTFSDSCFFVQSLMLVAIVFVALQRRCSVFEAWNIALFSTNSKLLMLGPNSTFQHTISSLWTEEHMSAERATLFLVVFISCFHATTQDTQ